MGYVVSHEGYKAALWDRHNKPACFAESDDAIVIAHNQSVGTAWAYMQRDITMITRINDQMCRDIEELRKVKAKLEARIRRQDDKIREQGEQLKSMAETACGGLGNESLTWEAYESDQEQGVGRVAEVRWPVAGAGDARR